MLPWASIELLLGVCGAALDRTDKTLRRLYFVLKHLLILGGIFAVFLFLGSGKTHAGPFTYDEADYMYAVSLGWSANWMDSPALSLPEFIKAGLRGRAQNQRADLSETIRDSNDVLFYRHWHGPIYAYWLRLVQPLALDERSVRRAGIVFPALATILLYFGALWLMPGRAGQIGAITASVLYLWSVPVVTTTELAPHQLFAVCVIAALLLLSKCLQASSSCRLYWYGALVATGLAFCLLEVVFALVLTVLICGYMIRDRLRPDLAFAAKSIGALLAPVAVFWPAAIFKLSSVKAYLFMAYLAVFRSAAWGNSVGFGPTWWLRFVNSPVLWILLVIAIGFYVRNRSKVPLLTPFAVFSIMMALAIFRVNSATPRYTLPLLPGVVLLSAFATGMLAARIRPVLRLTTVVLICAAMFMTSWLYFRSSAPVPAGGAEALLAFLHERGSSQRTLLVPHSDLPMLHYYFPKSRFKTYYDEAEIPEQIRSGALEGVIFHRLMPPAAGCSAEAAPQFNEIQFIVVCP